MISRKILVCGVGINDLDKLTYFFENGKQKTEPLYETWRGMLRRCYKADNRTRNKSYQKCTVCAEWLSFSNFYAWAIKQEHKGKDLDKDLLNPGNTVYCPEFCCFIDGKLNRFLTRSHETKKELPLGVSYHKATGKYHSSCNNPLLNRCDYLGVYDCPQEAHLKWKSRKHSIACSYADMQKDQRIAEALRKVFL